MMERYDDSREFGNVAPQLMVCDRCQERQATVKFSVLGGARYMLEFADEYDLHLRRRDELEASDLPGWADEWYRICFVCADCAEAVEFEQMVPSVVPGHRRRFVRSPDPGDHLQGGEGQRGSGVREPRRPRPSGSASEIAVDPKSEPDR